MYKVELCVQSKIKQSVGEGEGGRGWVVRKDLSPKVTVEQGPEGVDKHSRLRGPRGKQCAWHV